MAKKDETPDIKLLKAAEKGDLEGVKEQLASKASVDALDDGLNTPLHLASYRGHLPVVQELLKNGADTTKGNENKDIPLHLASLANRLPVIKVLLDRACQPKCDLECQDAQGYCPLHYACGEGHTQVAMHLVREARAKVDSRNQDGLTPVMCAVQQGHLDVTKMLLEFDPTVINHTNNSKDTPLHYATISEASLKMLELLLRNGANPDIKNAEGHTALVEAVIEKKPECAQLLRHCMLAYKQYPGSAGFTTQTQRAEAFNRILDGSWRPSTELPTPEATAPDPATKGGAASTKTKSKFSSQRAGLRTKTTVEVVREEFAAAGIAPKPKAKSRIMQPASTFNF